MSNKLVCFFNFFHQNAFGLEANNSYFKQALYNIDFEAFFLKLDASAIKLLS